MSQCCSQNSAASAWLRHGPPLENREEKSCALCRRWELEADDGSSGAGKALHQGKDTWRKQRSHSRGNRVPVSRNRPEPFRGPKGLERGLQSSHLRNWTKSTFTFITHWFVCLESWKLTTRDEPEGTSSEPTIRKAQVSFPGHSFGAIVRVKPSLPPST